MNVHERIKIFADGASLTKVPELVDRYQVKGFTTNPTLMAKEGIRDYQSFATEFLKTARGMPVSFEVFADDLVEMERQAHILAGWGETVYVKIPITNTLGISTAPLIQRLAEFGCKVNVTAVFTPAQIDGLLRCFSQGVPAVVSIFAGRIADAGIDPTPIMRHALDRFRDQTNVEILWASCREIFNIVNAADAGCHIITVPIAMLDKLSQLGKPLEEFSLDTVKMFRNDAVSSGFML